MTFDKTAKTIQWTKSHLFNKWCSEYLNIQMQKKKKNEIQSLLNTICKNEPKMNQIPQHKS